MNYLKVNLVIGIDYLFNGNSSNPDFQKTSPIMRISDNKAIEKHMNSTTKVNAKLNNATISVDRIEINQWINLEY